MIRVGQCVVWSPSIEASPKFPESVPGLEMEPHKLQCPSLGIAWFLGLDWSQ
jgi:hypothetical protein